jgi:hypothetical protein
MPIYRLIFVGHFCGENGDPRVVGIPCSGHAAAAGFCTTRTAEAADCEQAAILAADNIHEERSEVLGKRNSAFTLEIESCDEVTAEDESSPGEGFTFFAED